MRNDAFEVVNKVVETVNYFLLGIVDLVELGRERGEGRPGWMAEKHAKTYQASS